MKKRKVCVLTVLLAIAVCLTACSQNAVSSQSTEPESNAPALSEEVKAAQARGIVPDAMLKQLKEPCTQKQATQLIATVFQRNHASNTGRYLPDMLENSKEDKTATRYWFAQAIYYASMETVYEQPYTDYSGWMDYCDENDPGSAWPDAQVIGPLLNEDGYGEGGVWDICSDLQEIENPADTSNLVWREDYGSSVAANYAMLLCDRTNGDKVLQLDENHNFCPQDTLTVEQAIGVALRYDRSFEPAAKMVAYADTAAYDDTIITQELLTRASGLPDASCSQLPSGWRGVLMFDMGRVSHQALAGNSDKQLYESEIAAIRQSSFNFIGLAIDFSVLQGPVPESGKINETRLQQLDQIIAWCMKYDIHVDLRCSGVGGCDITTSFADWNEHNHNAVNGSDDTAEFAELWGVLARRYQGISDRDLSFNLFIEPEVNTEEQYAAFFAPAVEAIRAESPQRCIIADIHSGGLTGENMAKLGVALSYHLYEPRAFSDMGEATANMNAAEKAKWVQSITWPYKDTQGTVYDASTSMDASGFLNISANDLVKLAQTYQVGVMIGEWGVFGQGLESTRYPDAVFKAFVNDMTDCFEKAGLGWCYGCGYGTTGILVDAPVVKDAQYEKLSGAPGYLDLTSSKWFAL